jgi:voltage-gated potassium channel
MLRAIVLLGGIFAVGTLGYRLIDGAGWWDAFYMTAITLTTVGYREVFPLSRAGEAFTVVLLLAGLGILLFVATEVGRSVLEGELRRFVGQVRRSRMIESLSGHEIVCGWGRMGQAVVEELQRARRAVVVIERTPEKVHRLEELKIPVVPGDATSESALRSAGVERARGLVACLADDAHNVYTVLTARSLSATLFIVARAGEEGAEGRIQRAGADRVVSPYRHGGVRLAQVLMKPTVVDFLDLSLGPAGQEGLELQQLVLPAAATLVGRTLAESDLRRRWGVGVVAVRRGSELVPNPEPSFRFGAGDVLIVLGTRRALDGFGSVCDAKEA